MKRQPQIDMRRAFMGGNPLHQLISIILGVFLLIQFARLVLFLALPSTDEHFSRAFHAVLTWMGTPLLFPEILYKCYTIFTGIFIHVTILSLVFNVIALYIFGRIFIEFLGRKRLLPLYLYAGIFGSLFTILLWQLPYFQQHHSHLIITGAGAPVLGIMATITLLYPNLPLNLLFLGPVRLKYITLFYLALDMVVHTHDLNWAVYTAQAFGLIFGISYAILFRRGVDLTSGWVRVNDRIFGKKVRVRTKVKMYQQQQQRPLTDDQYNTRKREREATLDEILDKISATGMSSLSHREKELLERYSREF